jgi:hypothetical protein
MSNDDGIIVISDDDEEAKGGRGRPKPRRRKRIFLDTSSEEESDTSGKGKEGRKKPKEEMKNVSGGKGDASDDEQMMKSDSEGHAKGGRGRPKPRREKNRQKKRPEAEPMENAYEKEREANIKRNEQVLQMLGLGQAVAAPKPAKKPREKKSTDKPKEATRSMPKRKAAEDARVKESWIDDPQPKGTKKFVPQSESESSSSGSDYSSSSSSGYSPKGSGSQPKPKPKTKPKPKRKVEKTGLEQSPSYDSTLPLVSVYADKDHLIQLQMCTMPKTEKWYYAEYNWDFKKKDGELATAKPQVSTELIQQGQNEGTWTVLNKWNVCWVEGCQNGDKVTYYSNNLEPKYEDRIGIAVYNNKKDALFVYPLEKRPTHVAWAHWTPDDLTDAKSTITVLSKNAQIHKIKENAEAVYKMKEENTDKIYEKVEEQQSLTFMKVTAGDTFTIIQEYGDRTTRNNGNFIPNIIFNMTRVLKEGQNLDDGLRGREKWKRYGIKTIGADASNSDADRDASSNDLADALEAELDEDGSSSSSGEEEQP